MIMQTDSETNKRNAIAFYRMAYEGNPALAVEKYVGADYTQHNPLVANISESISQKSTQKSLRCVTKQSSFSELPFNSIVQSVRRLSQQQISNVIVKDFQSLDFVGLVPVRR